MAGTGLSPTLRCVKLVTGFVTRESYICASRRKAQETKMVLGMSIATFTIVHVIISLIAIAAGAVACARMLEGRRLDTWNSVFLLFTVLTTVTGFLFPITVFTPALGVGIVSMIILAIALFALYVGHLAGAWRWIYVASALFAFYLNVFVLVVQSFQKISFLNKFAPTGSEPPFAVVQGVVLLGFILLGFLVLKRFRPA